MRTQLVPGSQRMTQKDLLGVEEWVYLSGAGSLGSVASGCASIMFTITSGICFPSFFLGNYRINTGARLLAATDIHEDLAQIYYHVLEGV
jgi:hypothetical protein